MPYTQHPDVAKREEKKEDKPAEGEEPIAKYKRNIDQVEATEEDV